MKKLEYTGDFETFWNLCRALVSDGIGMAYNVNKRKGIAVTETDETKRTTIWFTKDTMRLEVK